MDRYRLKFLGSVQVPFHKGNDVLCAAMQKVRGPSRARLCVRLHVFLEHMHHYAENTEELWRIMCLIFYVTNISCVVWSVSTLESTK